MCGVCTRMCICICDYVFMHMHGNEFMGIRVGVQRWGHWCSLSSLCLFWGRVSYWAWGSRLSWKWACPRDPPVFSAPWSCDYRHFMGTHDLLCDFWDPVDALRVRTLNCCVICSVPFSVTFWDRVFTPHWFKIPSITGWPWTSAPSGGQI